MSRGSTERHPRQPLHWKIDNYLSERIYRNTFEDLTNDTDCQIHFRAREREHCSCSVLYGPKAGRRRCHAWFLRPIVIVDSTARLADVLSPGPQSQAAASHQYGLNDSESNGVGFVLGLL
jgi:hypothetical protein